MNREVLYRAKTKGSGEWVYGYYCKYGKHIHKIHSVDKYGNAVVQCDIDIVTLCEYTGLKDKNGNRIFEDDILKWDSREWGGEYNEIVRWDYGQFNMRKRDWGDFCEVIGNIYDNPELLTDKE